MDLQGMAQAVLVAGGTVIVSSIASVLSGASWRSSVRRDLELYETLTAHARSEDEREVADAMRRKAFDRARAGATRKDRTLVVIERVFCFAPSSVLFLAVSAYLVLTDPDRAGSPKSISLVMGLAIVWDVIYHAVKRRLDKKAEGEHRPAEEDMGGEREEKVDVREDDHEPLGEV